MKITDLAESCGVVSAAVAGFAVVIPSPATMAMIAVPIVGHVNRRECGVLRIPDPLLSSRPHWA